MTKDTQKLCRQVQAADRLQREVAAEQATGCIGAGSYAGYAFARGFTIIEVLDWSSSAGDWTFIVSKNGQVWYILEQQNNWPEPGFSHAIEWEDIYIGTRDEVLEQIYEEIAS